MPSSAFSAHTWRSTSAVPRHWTFGGHSYSLKPGRYIWYVWPGFGKRAKHHFGARIGTSAFVVAK